jgi:hypothetical protein
MAASKLNPVVNAANVAGEKKQNLYALEVAQKKFAVGSDEYKAIEAQKTEILGTSNTKKSMQDASPEVEQKTATTSTDTASTSTYYREGANYNKVTDSNPLNSYKSYTYNFTLAALDANSYDDPKRYRGKPLERVVLTSKGKGTKGVVAPTVEEKYADSNSRRLESASASLVRDFNQQSPGRFDMFIDEVKIESILLPGKENGFSQSCKMSFEVTEPYSINGFLEALHATAVSAGYSGYMNAKFVMLVEFVGYPDDQDLPAPRPINKSSRYFPLILTKAELTITEKGTVYKCEAVTPNDKAMGNSNELKATVNMKGTTIYEILTNFTEQLNNQIAQSDKDGKAGKNTKHDIYSVAFPTWDEKKGLIFADSKQKEKEQSIAKSKIADKLENSLLYEFVSPSDDTKQDAYGKKNKDKPTPSEQTSNPEKNKPNPYTSGAQIQVAEKTRIHNIIEAVIRDSEYSKNIIDGIANGKTKIETDGLVDYFMIRVDVKDLKEIDEVSKKPYQEFKYVIWPFKVHYSNLPNLEKIPIDYTKLMLAVGRAYNYIYMGKNVDILNFKLEFNNLYYEAIGKDFGNTDQPSRRDSVKSNESSNVKATPVTGASTGTSSSQNLTPTQRVDSKQTSVHVENTVNAGQPQSSPYYQMARAFHDKIINSSVSLVSGEIEIIGDPYYLTTGGWGNYNPEPDTNITNSTVDGEAIANRGELQIAITFNNPIDYGTFEEGGTMYFDTKKVPFGGIFKVTTLTSSFKDGFFKQTLTILRQPGQFLDDNKNKSIPPSRAYTFTPNPINQSTPVSPLSPGSIPQANGTLASFANGVRPDTLNAETFLGRGYPNPGLPGSPSNFTNALGGLGGITNPLLNQVSGATANGLGLQNASNGIFGGAIPGGVDQLASGIRMQASGLYDLANSSLGTASDVIRIASLANNSYLAGQSAFIAGNIADESLRELGINPVLSSMASRLVSQQASQAVIKSGILGSGLGKFVTKGSDALLKASGALQKVSQIASINPQNYIQGLASSKINSALNLSPKDQAGLLGLASATANITANSAIRNIVPTSLLGTSPTGASFTNRELYGNPINPRSLADQVGINAPQLSGLSTQFTSFISKQVSSIVDAIPTGVNLQSAQNQGIILDNLTPSTIANLPPTVPYASAPPYITDSSANGSFRDVNRYTVPETTRSFLSNGGNVLNQQTSMNTNYGIIQNQFYGANAAIVGTQLSGYMAGLPGLTGIVGSVESAQATVNSVVGSYPGSPNSTDLGKSVVTQFGSTSALSPLQKLVGG